MRIILRRPAAYLLFGGAAAVVLGGAALATAAAPPPPAATKGQRQVDFVSDGTSYKTTQAGKILTLSRNVRLKSEDTTLVTDLAMLNDTTKVADSPGKLKIDDAQNTIIGNKGVAYYKTRDAKITGDVQITVRPKPSDKSASEGSARREFKSPVMINCDNVDYNWKRKIAIATGHLTFHYEDRTVTADRATFFGDEEKVILEGHVHYTRTNGDHIDGDTGVAILKEGAEQYHAEKRDSQNRGTVTIDDEETDGKDAKPNKTAPPVTEPPSGPAPVSPSSPAALTNNVAPPVTPTAPPTDPSTPPATVPPAGTGNPASGPATPTKP